MEDKDELTFTFRGGYYNSEDVVEIPAGALIVPSTNILYNRKGKPFSLKDLLFVSSYGGSRAFLLDNNVIGTLGIDNTSNKGIGNIIQNAGRKLWFVGNNLHDIVRANSGTDFSTPMQIGGVNQVETLAITIGGGAGPASAGSFNTVVTGAYIAGSPLTISTTIGNDNGTVIAGKLATAIRANAAIMAQYYCYASGATVKLRDRTVRGNDGTLSMVIQANTVGVDTNTSTNTTAGYVDTAADLNTIPQLATWNGTGWNVPVQVGLAEQDIAPVLILTTDTTRDPYFSGIMTGSISGRLARKRGGTVSIASGASNIVTGETDSCYVLIPQYTEDGSDIADRTWILYFTYKGKGSLLSHFQFPIEIPENKLNGIEANGWESTQGNARIKVISQHMTDQNQRKIEVEFYDNDLLLIEPFDDHYSAGACKFLAPLGNVMCLVGSGTDSTAFDVSFPNFREAYNPEWRDWFSEVPISIASSNELGMFWILTANTTYQAIWTGATQETAPVILRQITSKYGAIGEAASLAVKGILYSLSKGKTPIRISSEGQIDIEFGTKVRNAFSAFDSTTQIGYDEENNTIVWICGNYVIGFQIDNEVWTSLGTVSTDTGGFVSPKIVDSVFSANGNMYVCIYDSAAITPTYKIWKYNSQTSTSQSWQAVGSFQSGKYGLLLKDIIEARIITENASQPYAIVVEGMKNFSTASTETFLSTTVTSTGMKISRRFLIEKRDYDNVAVKVSGTGGGQTVHAVQLIADIHEIERE